MSLDDNRVSQNNETEADIVLSIGYDLLGSPKM